MAAVLLSVGLAELDAGDLGDRIPFVRRLQRSGEQRLLFDRLRGQFRIDAGGTEEQETVDAGQMRGMNDVRFDHQIVVDEIGRERIVGVDAADLCGGQHNRVGTILPQPRLDAGLITQIHGLAIGLEDFVTALGQTTGDRGPDHALVSGDPDFSRTHELIADVPSQSVITADNCLTSPAHGHPADCAQESIKAAMEERLNTGRSTDERSPPHIAGSTARAK